MSDARGANGGTTAEAPPQARLTVRARNRVRSRVSEYPMVYLPFARRKYPGPSPEVIGSDTRLVIDGYTRSASTFAVYALQLAQEHPVRMAHHLHAPAQLVRAALDHVPTLLVIREPRGALLSQVVREPGLALRDVLVAYCRFHERLVPFLGQFVVGEFGQVTNDFGSVVRALNGRFALTLAEPAADQAGEVNAFVEQRGSLSPLLLGFESGTVSKADARRELLRLQALGASDAQREQWRPSEQRNRTKELLVEEWNSSRLASLRSRAREVFDTVTAGRAADGAALRPATGGHA